MNSESQKVIGRFAARADAALNAFVSGQLLGRQVRRYIAIAAAMLIAGCSAGGGRDLNFSCVVSTSFSDGWLASAKRARGDWNVDWQPYSYTKNGSRWDLILSADGSTLTVVADVGTSGDYCWIDCGRVKRIDLTEKDAVLQRGFFRNRLRVFDGSYYSEEWEITWTQFLGVTVGAQGSMSIESKDTSPQDPVQERKAARIDLDC
jgi:hypothetical protein